MTPPGQASVLFICERPVPDRVLGRVADELGEALVHAPASTAT